MAALGTEETRCRINQRRWTDEGGGDNDEEEEDIHESDQDYACVCDQCHHQKRFGSGWREEIATSDVEQTNWDFAAVAYINVLHHTHG